MTNTEDTTRARKQLRRYLRKGKTVYTMVTKVARSGMSRRIKVYTIHRGELVSLTWAVGIALGRSRNDDGLLTHGCGMDMGFETVYNLSAMLYPKTERGGYVLRQEWIG